jgi:hypothetical protein
MARANRIRLQVGFFGAMTVKDLERVSTALFLARRGIPAAEIPVVLRRVKPHIVLSEATTVLGELRGLGFEV